MLILCFDFGMKYIGVAIGQKLTHTTNSLPAILAKDGIPHQGAIEKLMLQWQPTLIIVGLPLTVEGHNQEITHCAKKFAQRLQDKYSIPIQLVDERYTTREAKKLTNFEGGKNDLERLKSQAAELILQRWLEFDN